MTRVVAAAADSPSSRTLRIDGVCGRVTMATTTRFRIVLLLEAMEGAGRSGARRRRRPSATCHDGNPGGRFEGAERRECLRSGDRRRSHDPAPSAFPSRQPGSAAPPRGHVRSCRLRRQWAPECVRDRHELGSNRRQVETICRIRPAALGAPHGRRCSDPYRRQRSSGRENTGTIRHREGRGRKAGRTVVSRLERRLR